MPDKRPSVKNERQYEALKDKGMSKERAARIPTPRGPRAAVARSPVREATPSKAVRPRRRRRPGVRAAKPPRGRRHRSRGLARRDRP